GAVPTLEDAGPVSPLLVAEDWAVEAPEAPEVARGSMVAWTLPPAPPLASVLAMESPPVTVMGPVRAPKPLRVTVRDAPFEPAEVAPAGAPPVPPVPPVRRTVVRLAASPVSPETESAADRAPELALEAAEPRTEASPVSPV